MSGLVMTLLTFTWLPPSWAAMLPQKFSAATTWITFPDPEPPALDDELPVPEDEVEQAVAVAAVSVATAATSASRAGR
ncbi:hypothetical protein GCM10009753_01450 [Streptantibioticus ferralitis]